MLLLLLAGLLCWPILLFGVSFSIRMALSFAYISESNVAYRTALKELGEDDEKSTRVKHRLFAMYSVGYTIGHIVGPGTHISLDSAMQYTLQ